MRIELADESSIIKESNKVANNNESHSIEEEISEALNSLNS